jgi:hypothetical protein
MPTSIERDECEYQDTLHEGKPNVHCHYLCDTQLCPDEMGGNEDCEGECIHGPLLHPCDDGHPCPLDDKETR